MTAGALDVEDLEDDRELELEVEPAFEVGAAAGEELVLGALGPRPDVEMLKLRLKLALDPTIDDAAADDPEIGAEMDDSETVDRVNGDVGKLTDAVVLPTDCEMKRDVLAIPTVLEVPPLHVPKRGSQLPGAQ